VINIVDLQRLQKQKTICFSLDQVVRTRGVIPDTCMSIVRKMRKIKLRKRATACAVLRISSLLYGLRKDDFPVLPHIFRTRDVDNFESRTLIAF